MVVPVLVLGLAGVLASHSPVAAGIAELRGQGLIVRATGAPGAWRGVELVFSTDHEPVPILFSTRDALIAGQVEVHGGQELRFSELRGMPTPVLGPGSHITFGLDDRGPKVSFDLELEAFDRDAWVEAYGRIPFHFLACQLTDALVFHQRGWPIPTPLIDPYPTQNTAEGFGNQIRSHWSRDWTYAPPLGAHPLPVVGLWAPYPGTYIGYDFLGTRLRDNSERDIATAYCRQNGATGQFFALVWPYASPYQTLRFPDPVEPGALRSSFRILARTDMGPGQDPNLTLIQGLDEQDRLRLPDVPPVNDLSWLPPRYRPSSFADPGVPRLYGSITEERWFKVGTSVVNGLPWDGDPITRAYEKQDRAMVDRLHADIEYLLERIDRLEVHGEECYAWKRPLEGDAIDLFRDGVETHHNIQTWMAGLAVLDAARNDPDRADGYLPYVDGILRWTRHVLYTRNGYPDVPSAQFCWGAGPVTTFCLRYGYTYRNDPERGDLAALALELARTMRYRYLPIWIGDNDRTDGIDSSFFMEPNSGINWLGSACANEVWTVPYALTQVYVATGDEFLAYCLRGMLERWHELYLTQYADSIDGYAASFTELYGLYPGSVRQPGERASFGFLSGLFENLGWPVLDSTVRVVCGEKAAIAFNRDGRHTDVAGYRSGVLGNFGFRLASVGGDAVAAQPFAVTVTCPYADLRRAPVHVRSADRGQRLLGPDDLVRFAARPDSLVLRGLRYGDSVLVGTDAPDPDPYTSPGLRVRSDAVHSLPERFVCSDLRSVCNQRLPQDWTDTSSYAGLDAGVRWLLGLPFRLVDPALNHGLAAVRERPIALSTDGNVLALLVTRMDRDRRVTLRLAHKGGGETVLELQDLPTVLRGWPMCFTWEVQMAVLELDRPVDAVRVQGADVLAVSTARLDPSEFRAVRARHELLRQDQAGKRRRREALLELKPLFKSLSGRIAILPIEPETTPQQIPLVTLLQELGFMEHCTLLTPGEFVTPSAFSAAEYWLTLYLGGESYWYTVATEGDGEQALRRYLQGGGALVILPAGVLPLAFDREWGRAVSSGPALGIPLVNAWEHPPEGVAPVFRKTGPGSDILRSLPDVFPFPAPAVADQRFRPALPEEAKGTRCLSWLSLVDPETGEDHGAGVAEVRYPERDGAPGGRAVYVWKSLLDMPEIGHALIRDVLGYALGSFQVPARPLHAYEVEHPPAVDAVLDEPFWELTVAGRRFQGDLGAGPLTGSTRLHAGHDADYLYAACRCETGAPGAVDDRLEFLLDDRRAPSGAGLSVILNPEGVVRTSGRLTGEVVGDGVRAVCRRVSDQAWIAELAIALPGGRAAWERGGRLGFQAVRRLQWPGGERESSCWTLARAGEAEQLGPVRFECSPLKDDFEEGTTGSPLWSMSAGEWRVEGGRLIGRDVPAPSWSAPGADWGLDAWGDCAVSVRFRMVSTGTDWRDGPWFGLRCVGDRGYFLNFGSRDLQLHKVGPDGGTADGTALIERPFAPDNDWHVLKVTLTGARIRAMLDEVQLLDCTDRDAVGQAPFVNGGIRLIPRCYDPATGSTEIHYDWIHVEPNGDSGSRVRD